MFKDDLLKGKRILVTGGGSGLGREIAARYLQLGAEVYICGRRKPVLDETAAELMKLHGGRVKTFAVDIRRAADVAQMVDAIWADGGALHGLVNNAAGNFVSRTQDLSPNGFDAVANIVLHGTFYVTQAVGKRWIADKVSGSVVSIVVTWVRSGAPFVVPSAMSKAGIDVMTKSLSVEWGPYGIRLNAIAPMAAIGAGLADLRSASLAPVRGSLTVRDLELGLGQAQAGGAETVPTEGGVLQALRELLAKHPQVAESAAAAQRSAAAIAASLVARVGHDRAPNLEPLTKLLATVALAVARAQGTDSPDAASASLPAGAASSSAAGGIRTREDIAALQAMPHDRPNSAAPLEAARRRSRAQEDASTGARGSTGLQIGGDRSTDVDRQGQLVAVATLAVHAQLPRLPVDVVEL